MGIGVRVALPESCKRRDRRGEEAQTNQPATEPQDTPPDLGSGQVIKTHRRHQYVIMLIDLWMATEELRQKPEVACKTQPQCFKCYYLAHHKKYVPTCGRCFLHTHSNSTHLLSSKRTDDSDTNTWVTKSHGHY